MDIGEVSLNDIYNIVHPFFGGAYVSDSLFLLTLAIIDTVLAVAWRIKKGEPIWSKRLKSGLIFNVVLSFLPQIIGVVYNQIHEPSPLLLITVEAVTIFIGLAQLQSILANAVLFGIKVPKWSMKWYNIIIEPEVEEKKHKDDKPNQRSDV
nr:phage holin family protein [Bacteroides intestinalis]